jgi:Sister chromatid cohesion protein Dcc1
MFVPRSFCQVNTPRPTGSLQTLSLQQLSDFLQRALTTIVSERLPTNRIDLSTLRSALLREQDIPEELTSQIIPWFGSVDDDYWEPDLGEMSKTIGLALLSPHKVWSRGSLLAHINILMDHKKSRKKG